MNHYIRSVEVIDRNRPALSPLFDEMRNRLRDDHGVTKARYCHAVPLADGARLAVSASPPIRTLAEDYVRNRRHEVDCNLLERMQLTEPMVWDRARCIEGDAPRTRAMRQRWELIAREAIGEGWWHGFDVAVFGPRGRRGLFKINAPLEQRLDRAYMGGVRHVVQDFHLAYCRVELAAEQEFRLLPEEQDAIAGVAFGMKAEAIGDELGITGRTVEERLARVRKRLDCSTTPQAVAKVITLGLVL
jgi:DNA-binding CsgD family transcriptional regulator